MLIILLYSQSNKLLAIIVISPRVVQMAVYVKLVHFSMLLVLVVK